MHLGRIISTVLILLGIFFLAGWKWREWSNCDVPALVGAAVDCEHESQSNARQSIGKVLSNCADASRWDIAMDEYVRRDSIGIDHLEKLYPPATPTTLADRLKKLAKQDAIFATTYPAGAERNDNNRRLITPTIRMESSEQTAKAIAAKYHTQLVASPALRGGVHLLMAGDAFRALEILEQIKREPGIRMARIVLAAKRFTRSVPNDPLFPEQWHLKQSSIAAGAANINVESVWNYAAAGNRGTGIRIGIIDSGVQSNHPDFQGNIDTVNDWDWNQNDNDANPVTSSEIHGTACAGNAAARGNNGIGVCGSAPEAIIVGMRLLGGAVTDIMEAEAMLYRNDLIPIKSNSWGPADDGSTLLAPGLDTQAALETAAQTGRGGRGTIIVFSGGNGALRGDNSNKDGYANSIYTIAVGATNSIGVRSSYSEKGANLVVCAPSNDDETTLAIVTTDRTGANGYHQVSSSSGGDYTTQNYLTGFGGTSSACPTVAGVVALMLQQNPDLGWRDVQEILMRSARKIDPTHTDWIVNAAGLNFNHHYGAGLVDAAAAVALSTSWTQKSSVEKMTSAATNLPSAIPDDDAQGITRTFLIDRSNFMAEHVQLRIDLSHAVRGQLDIRLISPAGTESQLAEVHGDQGDNYQNWTFSSVRNWGEQASGVWTVKISDRVNGQTGLLQSATLTVHGSNGNLLPKVTSVALSASGNAYGDQSLSVTSVLGFDPDGDEISYTYQWQSSEDGETFSDSGITSQTLLPLAEQTGKLWRCKVTPADARNVGLSYASPAVNLLTRPVATVKPGMSWSYTSGLVIASKAPRPAIIHEFSQGSSSTNREWVELLTLEKTSLAGWSLADSDQNQIVFAQSAVWQDIPAGTLIVIYNGGSSKDSNLPADDFDPHDDKKMVISSLNRTYFESGYQPWIPQGNSGDAIFLRDGFGREIDGIAHGFSQVATPRLATVGSGQAAAFVSDQINHAESATYWSNLNPHTFSTPGLPNGTTNDILIQRLRSASTSFFQLANGTTLPLGLSLDKTSGVLSGLVHPSAMLGDYFITIEKENLVGDRVSQTFTLTVSPSTSYDQWREGFPTLEDIGETADPDGDGLPNLVEFLLFEYDPSQFQSDKKIVFSRSGNYFQLEWRESKDRVGYELRAEKSSSLEPDSWGSSGITVETIEDLPTNRLRRASVMIDAMPKQFLRLKAVPSQ